MTEIVSEEKDVDETVPPVTNICTVIIEKPLFDNIMRIYADYCEDHLVGGPDDVLQLDMIHNVFYRDTDRMWIYSGAGYLKKVLKIGGDRPVVKVVAKNKCLLFLYEGRAAAISVTDRRSANECRDLLNYQAVTLHSREDDLILHEGFQAFYIKPFLFVNDYDKGWDIVDLSDWCNPPDAPLKKGFIEMTVVTLYSPMGVFYIRRDQGCGTDIEYRPMPLGSPPIKRVHSNPIDVCEQVIIDVGDGRSYLL